MNDVCWITAFDRRWWYVVRRFEDPDEAAKQFIVMNEHAAELEGKAEIAGYRLMDAPPDEGGKPRIIVVIGHLGERVEEAAGLLGGEPWEMPWRHVIGLIARRLRFLAAASTLEAPYGVHTFSHPGGLRIDESGAPVPMDEP